MKSCPCSKGAAFALLSCQAIIVVLILYLPAWSPVTLLTSPVINATATALVNAHLVTGNASAASAGGTLGIDRFPDLKQLYPVQRLSAPQVPRALAADDYDNLMLLLSLTIKVLEEHDIDYVLFYGSLLGSYVMHDLLPWDDDIDIFIHNDSKAKAMDIFRNTSHYDITGYHFPESSGQIFKIFFNHSKHAGKYPWKYPFLDLLTYIEKGKIIRPVETVASSRFAIPTSSFYPFHKRPFGSLWVNSPREPAVFFRAKYRSFQCKSGFWDHKHETGRKTVQSSCEKLTKYYPFVQREKHGNRTKETLLLHGVAQYSIVVDEPYHASSTKYGF